MSIPSNPPTATPHPAAPSLEAYPPWNSPTPAVPAWQASLTQVPEPGLPSLQAPTARPPKPAWGRPRLLGACFLLILLTVPAWLTVALMVGSIGLAVIWIGLPLWLAVMAGVRGVVRGYRALAGRVLGERIVAVRRPSPRGTLFQRLSAMLTDPGRWREIGYLLFAVTAGFALALASLIAFIVFPVGFWLSPLLLRLWASATKGILGPTAEVELQQRVGRLEESRSEAIDHSAAELRRIERDLHDGAQAQLVAVGMNLGLAEELAARDPEAAARLIADARTSSQAALADLRSLVRGIHPPLLADRGLPGAIEALALAHPRPVSLDVDLPGRPPAPVESAVYFAVAESLANSAKHAAAQEVWIRVRYELGALTALIGDDGVGGAVMTPAGGLAGLARRLDAFDGTMTVASPPGGPTIVTVSVPCALTPARPRA